MVGEIKSVTAMTKQLFEEGPLPDEVVADTFKAAVKAMGGEDDG